LASNAAAHLNIYWLISFAGRPILWRNSWRYCQSYARLPAWRRCVSQPGLDGWMGRPSFIMGWTETVWAFSS